MLGLSICDPMLLYNNPGLFRVYYRTGLGNTAITTHQDSHQTVAPLLLQQLIGQRKAPESPLFELLQMHISMY